MYVAGIDIGTTSVCCVIADAQTGAIANVAARTNDAERPSEQGWDRTQDPRRIVAILEEMIAGQAVYWKDVSAIGISCQMHGILYVDGRGDAVSPLYTWQDRRGDLALDRSAEPTESGLGPADSAMNSASPANESSRTDSASRTSPTDPASRTSPTDRAHRTPSTDRPVSWASYMEERSGHRLASGYGLVTHCYNLHHNLVPPEAVYLCTVGDYVAMKLCGRNVPLMDASNAASLGLYDSNTRSFDLAALEALGIDPRMIPPQAGQSDAAGTTPSGGTVACAIGDNQASFLGSVPSLEDTMLVNVGTGAQISVYSKGTEAVPGLETRPFPGGGSLLVGASLGGGKTYALLEGLFRSIHDSFAAAPLGDERLYKKMNALAEEALRDADAPLQVSAQFFGTREDPGRTGTIAGVSERNWTAGHLALGFLNGIVDELLAFAERFPEPLRSRVRTVAASGNGMRQNPVMRQLLRTKLRLPLHLSPVEEEAALGAAIHAAVRSGMYPNVDAAVAVFGRSELK
ncbi:sedoheptulokinase [Cohnella cellulosilytica]|uniref:Sedoheptulokinase n=1 Tax=Cohnella cellulosilytica TaxID=986710 RepID=A0ABW2F463_9BACL